MKWVEQTHPVPFELFRHFLARMFDSELFSTPGQMQRLVIGVFSMALPAGIVLLDLRVSAKYRRLSMLPTPEPFRAAALADELALLTLLFAVVGVLALLQWQSLFPGRRDYLALAGLPVRSSQIFAARFASVLFFSIALLVTINFLPSLVTPLQAAGRWQKNPSYLINVVAQGVSCGLSCFFTFFAVVALQGVLLILLPARLFVRASGYLQGLLIALLFFAGLFSWSISDWGPYTACSA